MVLKILLVALLLGAPANLASSRTAFSKCLGSFTRSQLKAGVNAAAFETRLPTVCKAEEAAFREASIATDLAAKIARATAERNASDEIGYIYENVVETFKASSPERQ